MSDILLNILQNIDQEYYTNNLDVIREFNTIKHVKVYQQHVYNFCGYHATFNILQMLNYLKYNKCQIYDSITFWKYVKQFQNQLKIYRNKHNINHEPWRDSDIEHGDFERSYLKPLKQQFNNIIDIIVVQYQFGRFVNSIKEREQIATQIQNFINYNDEIPLIQAYMLGITFHWVSFIAIKTKNEIQFYFMDSKNIDYCEWNVDQIQDYLNNINNERIKIGKQPYKPYELDMYLQGILDLQGLVNLMAKFLKDEVNFREYNSDTSTLMYVKPLYEMLGMNEQQFLDCDPTTINQDIIQIWSQEYKHTIFSVFKEQQIFYNRSRILLQKINQITKHIHQQIGQQEVHNPFQQCHDVIQGQVESFNYPWSYTLKEKQINIYFNDCEKIEHYSYLLSVKKVYFREITTKTHHYHLRMQFYENIFHPQGGGQPDDKGSIIVQGKEFHIKNMINDRQLQESYIDIEFNEDAYNLLMECLTQKAMILQKVDQNYRQQISQIHSAGHILQEELIQYGKNFKYVKGMHFIQEKYVQMEGELLIDINNIPKIFILENLNLSIQYLTHEEVFEKLGYVPEFVEFSDVVRWIKLKDNHVGYPCYGTHTVKELKKIVITEIVKNNNIYTFYYNLN